MTTTPTSPRCWFRFSLRTMFVAVTFICCFFGWIDWNRRMVQEGKDCLRNMGVVSAYRVAGAPFPRNLFEDDTVFGIALLDTLPKTQVDRICTAYPEAKIILVPDRVYKSFPWPEQWDRLFPAASVIQQGK